MLQIRIGTRMHQSTKGPQQAPHLLSSFEIRGEQFCFGSAGYNKDLGTYSQFLQEIYGIGCQLANSVDPCVRKVAANGPARGITGDHVRGAKAAVAAFSQFLTDPSSKQDIPLLVFAYCHQASLQVACDYSGVSEGPGAQYVRLDILSKLSALQPLPAFCLDLLGGAVRYLGSDKVYVETLQSGKQVDLKEEMQAFVNAYDVGKSEHPTAPLRHLKETTPSTPHQDGATLNVGALSSSEQDAIRAIRDNLTIDEETKLRMIRNLSR